MRCAFVFFLIASPVWGQPAQPNHVTPAEAREGWLLLFDGQSTYGFTTKGDVRAVDGKIVFPAGQGDLIWPFGLPSSFVLEFESRGLVTFRLDQKGNSLENIYESPADSWKRHTFQYESRNGGFSSFSFRGLNNAAVRSIKLKPLGGKSLFTGKDLSGWSIFDGKKSKFDVKEGCITIEDGPGDLQTDGKYKNFLFQIECKTNGKNLNGGVFFRCRAGEYQNGYEAQINNNFLPEESKEYLVEQYDPKTNKLVGKTVVKSAAADYGTGAIYRRIPARKAVAKDGEWFTLTVLASGNHLATWVDGLQTVDWYDHRPPSDNARTGYRQAAGHISLQGHDPTTNLSFKNIRIVELPD